MQVFRSLLHRHLEPPGVRQPILEDRLCELGRYGQDALYRFASSTPSIFSGFLSCPFGFHERWTCTACGREPHIYPGTRRGFKWVGLFILLLFSVAFWALPLTPGVTPDVRGWPTLSVFAGILGALACPEGSRTATSLPSPNWPLLHVREAAVANRGARCIWYSMERSKPQLIRYGSAAILLRKA
jgi:hypothetical protein